MKKLLLLVTIAMATCGAFAQTPDEKPAAIDGDALRAQAKRLSKGLLNTLGLQLDELLDVSGAEKRRAMARRESRSRRARSMKASILLSRRGTSTRVLWQSWQRQRWLP